MVTLEQVYERVLSVLRGHDIEAVKLAVRTTIVECGMCVNSTTGEVYDPAPKPVINYPNEQNGVRFSGQQRRRRMRR